MNDSETRIIEPLAKFHARVLYNGRIALPENTRLRTSSTSVENLRKG